VEGDHKKNKPACLQRAVSIFLRLLSYFLSKEQSDTMTNYRKDDPATIRALFGSIAERYDTTNAVLSLGLHALWNRHLVASTLYTAGAGPVLDLCCGTGQIAWTYLKQTTERQEVHLIDFCPEMLAQAQKRAHALQLSDKHTLIFTQSDAQELPLGSHSMAAATVAYGIRNVCNPTLCLQELRRVIAPGGRIGILELTRPQHRLLQWGHALYLRHFLPLLGYFCTTNRAAYSYLSTSIDTFIEPSVLQATMQRVGFVETHAQPLWGGIAHLFTGRCPW
jgi:demethylmenaquinone methyltransferase/2-methoxy-6-polyprenyl-1,4-benzoquinol methylase